jgi:hypothetical protein
LNILRRCILLAAGIMLTASPAGAQDWSEASDGTFSIMTAAAADTARLPDVFDLLQQARRELRQQPAGWQLQLCSEPRIWIHPDLASFTRSTQLPWFVLAAADRTACELHLQRLVIVRERSSLPLTLRHELFHLAQPDSWPRWLAEGRAMRFAGEMPVAVPLAISSEAQLDLLLAQPPDQVTLVRAAATAFGRALSFR